MKADAEARDFIWSFVSIHNPLLVQTIMCVLLSVERLAYIIPGKIRQRRDLPKVQVSSHEEYMFYAERYCLTQLLTCRSRQDHRRGYLDTAGNVSIVD
jgi:hypothetical protein